MIRRDINGGCVLIAQHDHSLLAGELARRLGNSLFAIPSPFEPVVLAVAEHDRGWAEADQRPELNAQGWPAHVFEGEILTAIGAWDSSVNQVLAKDKYAGLLVSLHCMALANLAAAREQNATDEIARQKAFKIRRFVHKQIELQEQLRCELAMRIDLPLRGGLAEEGLCRMRICCGRISSCWNFSISSASIFVSTGWCFSGSTCSIPAPAKGR